MNNKKSKNIRKVIYKCGVDGCCPIVEHEGKYIFIKDDYNNTVKMTKDQWSELVNAFAESNNK